MVFLYFGCAQSVLLVLVTALVVVFAIQRDSLLITCRTLARVSEFLDSAIFRMLRYDSH